jgi:hypothetical protein
MYCTVSLTGNRKLRKPFERHTVSARWDRKKLKRQLISVRGDRKLFYKHPVSVKGAGSNLETVCICERDRRPSRDTLYL